MNLLSSKDTSQKKYVVDMMRQNKLSHSGMWRRRFVISKKWIPYVIMFGMLAIFPVLAYTNSFSIVNADVLGDATTSNLQITQTINAINPQIERSIKSVSFGFSRGDKRVIAIKKFLEQKKSPLSNYADLIVREADAVKMDYRLLVGISGVESGFCRITTSATHGGESHNCWGWGKTRDGFMQFLSWSDAIIKVTRGIDKGYGPNPQPAEMQNVYCYSCGLSGSNKWQEGVRGYMSDISRIEQSI